MTRIYADTADLDEIIRLNADPRISGFTTNPTLMRKAGVTDYMEFARAVLREVKSKPVNFMVLSDDPTNVCREACFLHALGDNVVVKIPCTLPLWVFEDLVADVSINATAVMTPGQVRSVASSCDYISVFAGRIADTGRDPAQAVQKCMWFAGDAQVIWASPRSVYDYYQASSIGCDIITLPPNLIDKLHLEGKDLDAFSVETARMFHEDGKGYSIE